MWGAAGGGTTEVVETRLDKASEELHERCPKGVALIGVQKATGELDVEAEANDEKHSETISEAFLAAHVAKKGKEVAVQHVRLWVVPKQ